VKLLAFSIVVTAGERDGYDFSDPFPPVFVSKD